MTDTQTAIRVLEMPASEVCIHLGVVGQVMIGQRTWGEHVDEVQLWRPNGEQHSFAINTTEAGWNAQQRVVSLPATEPRAAVLGLVKFTDQLRNAAPRDQARLERGQTVQLFVLSNTYDVPPAIVEKLTEGDYGFIGLEAQRALRIIASGLKADGHLDLVQQVTDISSQVMTLKSGAVR